MDAKSGTDQSEKLAELNKKILEVKKKIQLTEGQRKALFEECEAERKANAETIVKLKKEISQMNVVLQENKSPLAKYRLKNKEIEKIIGPFGEKSCNEVQELIDLQITDKRKQIDLLKYRTKQRKKYLAELAEKYQKLLSKEEIKELEKKVEQPVKKTTGDLQNNIHSVEVKIREALHVRNRYLDIKRTLKEDSDNFECNIKKLEEELEAQRTDIDKLQKIMDEATRMRQVARQHLLHEENAANAVANQREKEAQEGRRLVNERKLELERLERKIFQTGKLPSRPEPEGAEDTDDKSPPPPHPVEVMAQEFEILKRATGGTNTEEVLEKFKAQKDTEERLNLLRNKSEEEKIQLQKKLDTLTNRFESNKFTEFKEAETKSSDIDRIQTEIKDNISLAQTYQEEAVKNEETLLALLEDLQNLHLCINPLAEPQGSALVTLKKIEEDINEVLRKIQVAEEITEEEKLANLEIQEEKWLPGPYNGLIRRSPIPQPGASPAPPPPPGSEDEEEVPSRGYLKRQAQLVIDAKLRRKNVRMLPKRN